jgi:N-acetylneuraminic acid mutarotase
MEAVIVKIGGFTSTSGVTNEITYHCQTENKWKFLTCIPHVDQCNFGSCVFDNLLYVIGGCFNQCSSLTEEHVHPYGFRYDPLSDSWTTISPMMTERCRFPLIVCGGLIYALGGVSCEEEDERGNVRDESPSSPCEAYDPVSDSWASILPIPGGNQRSQHAAVAVDDRFIFISGGLDSSDNVLDSMYCFDTKLKSWSIKPSLPTPRADHTMICYGNRIIVCGGWCEENDGRRILISSVESFDLVTESWDPVVVTDIPTPRFHSGIVMKGDILWIMGGFVSDDSFDDRGCGLIECFNLKTKEWSTPSAYPQDIWEHSTAVLYVPTSRREEDADVC